MSKNYKKKNKNKSKNNEIVTEERKAEIQEYIRLVNKIKKSNKQESDIAFEQLVNMMNKKLQKFVYKFNIPGFGKADIYNEILIALRYKAIEDFNKDRGDFDRFAMLCINRHLSTKLKSTFQNRNKVNCIALSIDQDRNNKNSKDGDTSTFLSEIISCKNEESVISKLDKIEFYKNIFKKLMEKLSSFEKEVFILYAQRYSYEEIEEKIKNNGSFPDTDIKSVDNALTRIKQKGRMVYKKYIKST